MAAVTGAVGAQPLPIGKSVFAIGVAFAACGIGDFDAGAEEYFGWARRAECLAYLRRRGGAAHQRKILSVAAAHAEARSRARDTVQRRQRRLRRRFQTILENIVEKRVLALLLPATVE